MLNAMSHIWTISRGNYNKLMTFQGTVHWSVVSRIYISYDRYVLRASTQFRDSKKGEASYDTYKTSEALNICDLLWQNREEQVTGTSIWFHQYSSWNQYDQYPLNAFNQTER